ncbi:unnamed protein product [Ilex paraguariensis]|uniref:Uncharacterized protein n=1 Tax=Ilex paraguariensis TaxID=185542 RepID=A0ABC8TVZ1_9AQUA
MNKCHVCCDIIVGRRSLTFSKAAVRRRPRQTSRRRPPQQSPVFRRRPLQSAPSQPSVWRRRPAPEVCRPNPEHVASLAPPNLSPQPCVASTAPLRRRRRRRPPFYPAPNLLLG